MKKLKNLLLMFVLVLSMAAPASTPLIGTVQTVSAAVKISKKHLTLTEGQTKKLKITGTSKKVKWSTSNKKVAAVSPKGKITAKKAGTAVITAKIGNKKYTCKITVEEDIPVIDVPEEPDTPEDPEIPVIPPESGTPDTPGISPSPGDPNDPVISPSPEIPGTAYVWLSETGTKYHCVPDCGAMDPTKARKVTKEEAQALGFEACKKCFK